MVFVLGNADGPMRATRPPVRWLHDLDVIEADANIDDEVAHGETRLSPIAVSCGVLCI